MSLLAAQYLPPWKSVKQVENAVIVAIICDRGDRYLSSRDLQIGRRIESITTNSGRRCEQKLKRSRAAAPQLEIKDMVKVREHHPRDDADQVDIQRWVDELIQRHAMAQSDAQMLLHSLRHLPARL